jgi:hypothetical protein
MPVLNRILTLVALGLIAVVRGAAAQDPPGEPRWRITPSPTTPELVRPTRNDTDAKFLKCPLALARIEIVSELAAGWWQTPFEGPLVATRVEVMGGKKTLICEYQAYTTRAPVMMHIPDSMDCVAATDGFKCH